MSTAIIAGVMGAKQTHNLVPFCHPLPLHGCDITVRRHVVVACVRAAMLSDTRR